MNVRSAGLKFKIATNFIWRVGRGVHHRDSTLPPYGWSSHGVNSERLFFSSIRRVEHRGVKRGDKILVLLPGTNTTTSNKREPICALPALSKLAISTKRDPICALLLQSVSAVWLSCSLEQKYPPFPPPPWNRTGHLEQARIDLCPAGSIKVGHFEQTRTDLCPARSIKVDHLEQTRSICALSKWTV